MKIRSGFVSNSSSSSFIVIDQNSPLEMENSLVDSHLEIDGIHGSIGETEFGWTPEDYYDVWSKINFAYIQAYYMKDKFPEWTDMIIRVIKEHTGAKEVVFDFLRNEYGLANAYIDHQSASSEGMNIEMFESDEAMKRFLFCPSSYIHTDNDNY